METPVQKLTRQVVELVHREADFKMKYADVVRAVTFALVSINETHRERSGE